MHPDPAVVAELRALFKAGATPSRLARHVAARHGHGPDADRLLRAYFREAFGLPMFRASTSLLTLPPGQLAFAGVTPATLHQMVENRGEWDAHPEGGWLGSLPVVGGTTGGSGRTETAAYLAEQVAILSRLVEQLQLQVEALEEQLPDRRHARPMPRLETDAA